MTTSRLNVVYRQMYAHGGAGDRALSPRTVQLAHAVLRRALADAVVEDVLLANLAVGVKLPKQVKPTHRTWTPEQLREFVTSVQAERLSALFVVLAFTGARRGEVLALRWSDVDVDGRAVRIERSATRGDDGYGEGPPKNGERRSVTVEAAVVAALRAWRKVQAAERLAWGPAYSPSDLVFTREDGSALDPDAVTKLFVRAVFGT